MTAVMAEAPVEESPLGDLESLVYTAPKVNLLPPEIGERRRLRKLQACLALAVVAAGAVVGLLYFQASSGEADAQARLDAAQSVQAGLQVQTAKLQYVQAEQARIDAARSSLKAAMGSEVLWSKVLDDLRLRLPDGVNMSSLATTAVAATTAVPGVAAPAAAAATATAVPSNVIATVVLSGSAVSLDAVADELDQLANVPGFSNVYLTTTTSTGESTKFVAYTATADVTTAALSHRYDSITGANK
jgi:Tfp pilus assembly protein PilN